MKLTPAPATRTAAVTLVQTRTASGSAGLLTFSSVRRNGLFFSRAHPGAIHITQFYLFPRVDFVQDLYFKELGAYKPAPKGEGPFSPTSKHIHIRNPVLFVKPPMTTSVPFSAPAPPQAPSPLADPASGLAQYGAAGPVSTPSTAATDTSHVPPGTTETDAFLSFLRPGTPKDEVNNYTTPDSACF